MRLPVGISCRFCEHGNKPTVSVKDGTFLRNMDDCLLLKNVSALRFWIRNVAVAEWSCVDVRTRKPDVLNPPIAFCQSGDASS